MEHEEVARCLTDDIRRTRKVNTHGWRANKVSVIPQFLCNVMHDAFE